MSFNVNELDNEVEMYLREGRQSAEEWRRTHGALPGRGRSVAGSLEDLVRATANRLAAVVGYLVCSVRVWATGVSEPTEERC